MTSSSSIVAASPTLSKGDFKKEEKFFFLSKKWLY